MRWDSQTRAVLTCFGLVSVFSLYSFRLIDLQILKHGEYSAIAAEKHVHKAVIYAWRGKIWAARHEVLADNLPVGLAVADGTHIREPEALARSVAPDLEMDPADLTEKFTKAKQTNSKYVVIKKDVPEEKATVILAVMRKAKVQGLYFDPDFRRIYPNGALLSQVIGTIDHDRRGILGIEKTMESCLRGQNGFRFIEEDRTGNELPQYRGIETAAKNGCDVTLTIDLGLQNIIENQLDAACEQYKPKMATIVVMRPQTGEILAMASRPTFDCNAGTGAGQEQKNRPIADMIEPGSTFKIVVTSAALEEKLVTPNTTIYCENGHYEYGGRVLRDAHPMGTLSVHEILSKSSNIGAAKLALQLGESRFYDYIRRYGFGEKTGIQLSGEIQGLVNPPQRWNKIDITRIPMGQSIAVTPIQMITAMSAVANGGNLVKPLIISQVTDPDGRPIATFRPQIVRRVISAATSKKVVAALKDVVRKGGTATGAAVPGFIVAGKTGTAQKINPKGGYLEGKYVCSFVGFMPADDPRFTMLVLLDDPVVKEGIAYGGTVAGPVFSKTAQKVAEYLDLRPTEPITPPVMTAEKKGAATALRDD